jgi:hypothetical protein
MLCFSTEEGREIWIGASSRSQVLHVGEGKWFLTDILPMHGCSLDKSAL